MSLMQFHVSDQRAQQSASLAAVAGQAVDDSYGRTIFDDPVDQSVLYAGRQFVR